MNARDYALSIVTGTTLEDKLAPPPGEPLRGEVRTRAVVAALRARPDILAIEEPGTAEPLRLPAPGRPASLAIVAGKHAKVPPLIGMRDPRQRARILHGLANHELQAIELFAWAVLAFPATPVAFRRGLLAILADEQRHFASYCERLAALGERFGDHGVTGHFWNKLDHLATPLEFVCAMCLTFENANLDFCGDYAAAARAIGDGAMADAIDQIHADEIRHVRFGWVWLRRLAADNDPWQAYLKHVRYPLGPRRARGVRFDREARRRAGLDDAFIDALAATAPARPSGQPR